MTDLLRGAGYLLRGLALVRQRGLRRFVVVPLAVNTLLFAGALVLAGSWLGDLIERYLTDLPAWLAWLGWLLWLLALAGLLVATFFLFTLVANLIAAPFNGLLAERVAARLGGRPAADEGWRAMLAEIVRSLKAELVKLRYIVSRTLVLAVLSVVLLLIPVVNAMVPVIWFVFGGWMMALEYLDPPMGNDGLAFPEARARLAGHRALGLGFGGAAMLASMVPVVNFAVMPVAVAGATALWLERLREHTP